MAKLEWLQQTALPSSSTAIVRPLSSDRDRFPDGSREYDLLLEYSIKAPQAGDLQVRFPLLNSVLYEAVFGSQFFMLYDERKRLIGTGDAWPDVIKLASAGDYIVRSSGVGDTKRSTRAALSSPSGRKQIRLCVRHNEPDLLEGLKAMAVVLEYKLKEAITLSVYQSRLALYSDSKEPFGTVTLLPPMTCSVYVRSPAADKIPKFARPGDVLIGTITYGSKGDTTTVGNGQRPGGFPLSVLVANVAAPPAPPSTAAVVWNTDAKTTKQRLLQDLYLNMVNAAPVDTPQQLQDLSGMDTRSPRDSDRLSGHSYGSIACRACR